MKLYLFLLLIGLASSYASPVCEYGQNEPNCCYGNLINGTCVCWGEQIFGAECNYICRNDLCNGKGICRWDGTSNPVVINDTLGTVTGTCQCDDSLVNFKDCQNPDPIDDGSNDGNPSDLDGGSNSNSSRSSNGSDNYNGGNGTNNTSDDDDVLSHEFILLIVAIILCIICMFILLLRWKFCKNGLRRRSTGEVKVRV